MEATAKLLMITVVLATTTLLVQVQSASPAQFLPPPLAPTECWSSLSSVQGCVMELYTALFNGQFKNVGPACCQAITKVSQACWLRMFPLNPSFPPLITSFCASAPPPSPVPALSLKQDTDTVVKVNKCWSPFSRVDGCFFKIYRSLFSAPHMDDPDCCKVVKNTEAKCWRQMFPANPQLPQMLKTSCAV